MKNIVKYTIIYKRKFEHIIICHIRINKGEWNMQDIDEILRHLRSLFDKLKRLGDSLWH